MEPYDFSPKRKSQDIKSKEISLLFFLTSLTSYQHLYYILYTKKKARGLCV